METDTQMDIVTFRLKNNASMPSLHFKMPNTHFAMINVKGSQLLTLFYYTLNPGQIDIGQQKTNIGQWKTNNVRCNTILGQWNNNLSH